MMQGACPGAWQAHEGDMQLNSCEKVLAQGCMRTQAQQARRRACRRWLGVPVMGEMYCRSRLMRPLAPRKRMMKADPAMPPDTTRMVYCRYNKVGSQHSSVHAKVLLHAWLLLR